MYIVHYLNNPNVKIVISTVNNILNGTNIVIPLAITINGPNGIYSFDFFTFININIILITAPSKNAITDIATIPLSPK